MSRYCSISNCKKLMKSVEKFKNLKNIKELLFKATVVTSDLDKFKVNGTHDNNNNLVALYLGASIKAEYKQHNKKFFKNEICQTLIKHLKSRKNLLVASTAGVAVTESIPEPPEIPGVPEVLEQLNALGEPTFASLGLGGYTPAGMVQSSLEYLHATVGLEWWAAIVVGTLVVRLTLFPLVVISQRHAAKMNNNLPQMQVIQLKMTEARQSGNQVEAARYGQELMLFMKEKGLSPFKNMIVPIAQMPVFISMFVGLRQMANLPVDSLRSGGLWWFTDLTLPDQYFLLPIITSATLYATIELGTDTGRLASQNLQTMKYVFRALPVVLIPFTINFPGVMLCYWVSSNFISLVQVAILQIPSVRSYFNIEQLITHKPETLPVKPKGFTEGLKDSWTNIKITKELEERRRLDEFRFQRAGKGPLIKTFKYDPTKQMEPNQNAPVSVKKR